MKKGVIVFVALLFFALIGFVNAQQYYDDYSDVLLVCNANSSVSQEICSYFIEKRVPFHFDVSHIVNLTNVSTTETISDVEFEKIYTQVNSKLSSLGEINYIVTTSGVPLRTSNRAVDSKLMARLGATNNYYSSEDVFTHEAYGGYLITRLTGYDAADAKRLIDNSDNANLTGKFLLNKYSTSYSFYDMGVTNAYTLLTAKGYSVELNNSVFVRNKNNLSGYWSWGSNAGCGINCQNSSAWNLSFNPGAIGETAVSTSAWTFGIYPWNGSGPFGGQSLILDLIHYNITGIRGYVYEPYLDAVVMADGLFDRYTAGYNLADTYYMSSFMRDWMDVVVGDPKTHVVESSSSLAPVVSLRDLLDGERINNGTDITFTVYLSKFYGLDSLWYSMDSNPSNTTISTTSYTIDTSSWSYGNHTIKVYANDSHGSESSKTFSFIINSTIGETPKYSYFNGNRTTNIKVLVDKTNVSGLTLEKEMAGKIDFLNNLSVSGLNLNSLIQFSDGRKVSINSSLAPSLNVSANITLYNTPGKSYANPVILRDGQICNATTSPYCYNFTALNASEVKFNVSSWSTYEISGNLITGCANISNSGTYTLVNDIETNKTCINVSSDDVVIDGNGHSIITTAEDIYSYYYFISANDVNNFTVRNFKNLSTPMYNYYATPIHLTSSINNSQFINNSFYCGSTAVQFKYGDFLYGEHYYNISFVNNSVMGHYDCQGIDFETYNHHFVRNLTVFNNYFEETYTIAIGIPVGEGVNISSNVFSGFKQNPIFFNDEAKNVSILNNIFVSAPTNSWSIAFYENVTNLFFKNNSINFTGSSGEPAIRFDKNVTDSQIINNSFFNLDYYDYLTGVIQFYNADSRISNVSFVNNYFENNINPSVAFTAGVTFSNISFIYNNSFAEMVVTNQTFLDSPSIAGNLTFPGYINLSSNYIYVNSTALPELNSSANLTFYFGPNEFSIPYIMKDSVVCTDCHNFTSLISDTVKFNVSSFSAYSLIENDTAKPNLTYISNSVTNQSVNVSFNVSDNGRLNNCTLVIGTLSNSTSNFSNPNRLFVSGLRADTTYTATLSCYDYADNVNSTNISFTTDSNPVAEKVSSGSGTYLKDLGNLESGFYDGSLSFGTYLRFNVSNESHRIGIANIDRTIQKVKFNVYSEKQEIVLGIGESKQIDLNADGKKDITLTLKSIDGKLMKVNIFLDNIEEVKTSPISNPVVEKIVEKIKEIREGTKSSWIGVFTFVLIIVLVVLGIMWKRKWSYDYRYNRAVKRIKYSSK